MFFYKERKRTQKNAKNAAFFYKERKRAQEHEKNIKPGAPLLYFLWYSPPRRVTVHILELVSSMLYCIISILIYL